MFSQSVFETKKSRNKYEFQEADVIFVADLFTDEYSGGAELTTEALFGTSPYKTYKIKSNELTEQLIHQGVNKTWVFFNFSGMNLGLDFGGTTKYDVGNFKNKALQDINN